MRGEKKKEVEERLKEEGEAEEMEVSVASQSVNFHQKKGNASQRFCFFE